MFSKRLLSQAVKLSELCRKQGIRIATAESCTGGLIAALLTEIPGSSDIFDRGFVTYSNDAKHTLLGVPTATLKRYGAVSEQTARAMALGVLKHSDASLSLAVTGIAGPGGGSKAKPVGLVYIGCAAGKKIRVEAFHFKGTRTQIREAAVGAALGLAMQTVLS